MCGKLLKVRWQFLNFSDDVAVDNKGNPDPELQKIR